MQVWYNMIINCCDKLYLSTNIIVYVYMIKCDKTLSKLGGNKIDNEGINHECIITIVSMQNASHRIIITTAVMKRAIIFLWNNAKF